MLRIFIIALVYMHVSGCAAIGDPAPFARVAYGHQIDSMSDYYRRTDREWECSDNGKAIVDAGLDWGKVKLYYHHQSWWTCGGPVGRDKPETWADDIRLEYMWGGKK